jgi:hypothetical protein
MVNPITIGMGIGAIGALATKQSPFKGALLGGLGGGFGQAAGLFGGAAGAGGGTTTALETVGPTAFAPAAGTVAPGILGAPTLNASLLTQGAMSGLGATPTVLGGMGASSLADKAGAYLSNLPSNVGSYIKDNPISSLKMASDVAMPSQQEQMMQPQLSPIRQGNFDAQSTNLQNVAPNIGQTKNNTIGKVDLATLVQQNPDAARRLAKFYPDLFGGM